MHVVEDEKEFVRLPSVAGRVLLCVVAVSGSCLSCNAYAQSPDPVATLRTSDAQIEVSATRSAPILTSLKRTGRPALRNEQKETLPANVFINGAPVPVRWQLKPKLGIVSARHLEFVYECAEVGLRLRWQWDARAGFGPFEHRIIVENRGTKEIWLPLIDSLDVSWQYSPDANLWNFYVEKGADTPSNQGTHEESVEDGYRWIGRSSTYAHPVSGEGREIIPAFFIYSRNEARAGWYAGIEFSGRTRITLNRVGNKIESRLGLNDELGPFQTRVQPGESFETPTVFLGAFIGGPDDAGNQLRPWVRTVLGNPLTWKDPQYPLMVNNSWGSGMQVDEPLALRMIADSRELGLEMFHLDAGWFRGVGDWYPDPKKFPHGLAAIADEAHRQGLRFGIWVDWSQAGVDNTPGALNVRDTKVRDWLIDDVSADWKPEEFKGQTIDLGVPAAHSYAAAEVKRIVESYHLDMLEHDGYLVAEGCTRKDHPHTPPNMSTLKIDHDSGFEFALGSNSTDVSYHSVRAYYDIYERLRREHPGLLFEICNDGGRMVDFGSAAHGDYFSITDTYDPLSNRRAFYDTSHVLPPAMLESYVEKWTTPRLENFLYMLRSGMMGWMSIMLDTTAWSPQQHAAARHAFMIYKEKLRPLIRDARLYHISERPDGVHWDGMEYWDPARRRGVAFVFRGSIPNETEHRFVLAGLEPGKRYRVHFEDGTMPDRDVTGQELMSVGILVSLPQPLSSELAFLEETHSQQIQK
ncbi:alpha-galactosidase [Telmatobacter sp. DSM 110680]|uniref:Alpha-galactosidase n=1 Tax=Telmatobacter sp. DSM 110680 TaxID=3036704 RepID=A0AAU7DPW1_9BACT